MKTDNWEKAKEIFGDALEHAPDERPLFLDEVCDGDSDTRREVESLLASLDSADSFMKMPAVAKVAVFIEAETKRLETGKCFGHYEIIEQIGAGGMGEVYLARDQKLDRQVAVKILNEKFSRDESNLQRFVSEAKAASALNHPNILVIHEIGESDEAHFIVSEFIKGKTLRESFKEKTLELSEVLDISIQIANALCTAHEAHLVHRDIKPENIMIRPDGYVKILDFGLAKLVEQKNKSVLGFEESTVRQNQTAKGVIMGTVNYMSPEQAKGERVDERTDIFSLGVVIYEMIAGRTPFAGDSMPETFANLINAEPQPFSQFAANVPDEMQRIVTKTLRKSKDERYQTMKDVLADLRDLRGNLTLDEKLEYSHQRGDHATGVLRATTGDADKQTAETQNSLSQTIKRHKPLAAFALIVLLAAIGLGVWNFTNRVANTTRIESIAVMPFVNESGNSDVEYLSDGMTESLINSLSQLPALNVKARSSVFRYKGKEVEPQQVAAELSVQAILNGRVVQRGDDLALYLSLVDARNGNQLWGEQYNLKLSDLVALQSEITRDVSQKLRVRLSGADEQKLAKNYTKNAEAYQLYLKGRYFWYKRTAQGLRKAIEYFQQAVTLDPNYALAYTGLSDAYGLLPTYGGGAPRESMPKAKEAALKALSLDNNLAEAHAALGGVLSHYDYDFAGGEREYKRAIELNPNYATAHQWYGRTLIAQERDEESLAEFRRALEIDPLSLVINRSYGEILLLARRYDESIAQLKKTLELDAGFVSAHYSLAVAYQMRGNYAEAVEEFAKSQELMGEAQKAASVRESYAVNGWQGFLRMIAEEHLQYNLPWDNLAAFHAALGEKDKAFAELNKSYENREIFMVILKVEPRLDPLREDPRFDDLVKRVGLK